MDVPPSTDGTGTAIVWSHASLVKQSTPYAVSFSLTGEPGWCYTRQNVPWYKIRSLLWDSPTNDVSGAEPKAGIPCYEVIFGPPLPTVLLTPSLSYLSVILFIAKIPAQVSVGKVDRRVPVRDFLGHLCYGKQQQIVYRTEYNLIMQQKSKMSAEDHSNFVCIRSKLSTGEKFQ
ncbi:hypothetical protein RUM44_002642 [Polyplax serrata]|uniref:Uncharacterized protein n=1 Tax=Polyplax serrata TaxID=468196 RepID=A0ABR1AFB9_POLSC